MTYYYMYCVSEGVHSTNLFFNKELMYNSSTHAPLAASRHQLLQHLERCNQRLRRRRLRRRRLRVELLSALQQLGDDILHLADGDTCTMRSPGMLTKWRPNDASVARKRRP